MSNEIYKKVDKYVGYSLIISSIFILIYNVIHYSPSLGYDAEAHFAYVNHIARYLPESLNLPNSNETREFFSPPLGYIVPAFGQVICRNVIESSDTYKIASLFLQCLHIYFNQLYI